MGAAEQQQFTQYPLRYGDGTLGAAIAQTRDGKDELVTPVALWELDDTSGLYLPPGLSQNPRRPRVDAQLSGRNPVRRLVRDVPLTAGQQVIDTPTDLTTVSPHIAWVAYEVRSDTSVNLQIQAASGSSPSWSGVGMARLRSPSTNVTAHMPRFAPMGSRYRIVMTNPTAVNQTVLEIEEIRYSDWVSAPQNLKALLVDAAPASIFTDTVTTHTVSSDPAYFDRLIRVAWGGGKVPLYVKSTLDQGIELDVVTGAWDPPISPTLGTKVIPASATIVITNADFPGIDVPFEVMEVRARAQVVPLTGILNVTVDTQVGGGA